jgi:hypothetical protein
MEVPIFICRIRIGRYLRVNYLPLRVLNKRIWTKKGCKNTFFGNDVILSIIATGIINLKNGKAALYIGISRALFPLYFV